MTPMEQLVSAFGRNGVVVVVGTGVTAAATKGAATSTWQGLLKDGIKRLGSSSPEKSALLELTLDQAQCPEDYASIAEQIKRALGNNFGRWLNISVGQLEPLDDRLINAIGDLRVPILTTNYDSLLERVLKRNTICWTQTNEMSRMLREGTTSIGHLHGIWTDTSSVIFSNEDYSRIIQDADAQKVQQAAFQMKSFLFVGVGDGLQDPNFDPMIRDFSRIASSSSGTHFRLCLNSDVAPDTELDSVVDIGFGEKYDDLPAFVKKLGAQIHSNELDLQRRSRERLLDTVRENSTMWRESETLNEKSFNELVVTPIFLPEPHSQFATSVVTSAEKQRPKLIDTDSLLTGDGILIVAGDENSGVTTAVSFCLNRAMDLRGQAHAMLIDNPLKAGFKKVEEQVRRTYRDWGIDLPSGETFEGLVLGIDNLAFDDSPQLNRALHGIQHINAGLKIIGVRQGEEASILDALRKAGVQEEIRVAYVGRFSNSEALELARRIAPGSSEKVAQNVMIIIREKNLPRTPFTMTLLIELIQSGVALQEEESELAVLDKYLDLLLSSDFLRAERDLKMSLRNKRKTLELLAQHFVERTEDHVPESDLLKWFGEYFAELGWSHSPALCLSDLVVRRVLSRRADGRIGFQRSTYLELMAGNSAKADPNFRKTVFAAPIALASIVRTYAAMSRDDEEVLKVVEAELDNLPVVELNGRVFGAVKKIAPSPDQDALSERSESDAETGVEEDLSTGTTNQDESPEELLVYDDSDDSDTPAFLLTRLEDIPQWRLMMYTVDLASRVLRDSDEVRNQDLKARVLTKLLDGWAAFAELYEREVESSTDLDDLIRTFFENDGETDGKEHEKLRSFLTLLLPCILTDSGIRYCLSGPSLTARLKTIDLSESRNPEFAALIRTIVLYSSGGTAWIDTLESVEGGALKSFFCAYFTASLARFAYVTDTSLTENELTKIRAFLRRIINERYHFDSQEQRNRTNNEFETKLNRNRLNNKQNPTRKTIER